MTKYFRHIITYLVVLFILGSAHASMLTFSLTGNITDVSGDRASELTAGNAVLLSGSFDNIDFTGFRTEKIRLGEGSGHTFNLLLDFNGLNQNTGEYYHTGYPSIFFENSEFLVIGYVMTKDNNSKPVNLTTFYADRSKFEEINSSGAGEMLAYGYWDRKIYTLRPKVMEHNNIIVFGIGLLSLAFFCRKQS